MINKVAFTGRETMLTEGLKKTSQKAQDFVSASSILPALPKSNITKPVVKEAVYTSPFAPTGKELADELAKQADQTKKINLYI